MKALLKKVPKRAVDDARAIFSPCPRKKCGEYNMLKCARHNEHSGECWFVVDQDNDYPWDKKK